MLKSPKVPCIDATTHTVEDGSALFFAVWTSMHRFGLLLLEVPSHDNLSTVLCNVYCFCLPQYVNMFV